MKVNSPKDLGLLVRDCRKSKGWTQAELAKRSGVKPLWISQFERGKSTAQVKLVFSALKALGIDLWTRDPSSKSSYPKISLINLDDIISS
ncbi:MAG: helix-turn-helix domain-containing protein [Verrucomicrobia bacterium]|nr:helix-turn-helix domain-containing protein [Verrucomicrobiota bacterium]